MKRGLLVFFSLVLLSSCTNRPVTPSRASRRAIDTIFQNEVIVMQPHLDSVCRQVHDSIYMVAVDSILNERRDEMNKLVK